MVTKFIDDYKLGIGVIAIMMGFFMLIWGNKFLKISFVIVLVIISMTFFIWIYYNLPIEKSREYVLWITIGIGFVFGLVIGYFLIKINALIYFFIGGYLGYLVGNILFSGIIIHIKNNDIAYYVTLVLCIIICGFISYKLSNHIIIVTTSVLGSYLIVRGASFYIGHFPSESVILYLIKNGEFGQLKDVRIIIINIICTSYINFKFFLTF